MLLSELTEGSLDTLMNKVVATGMRDQLFLPIALDSLNYTVRFRSNLPWSAPACVCYDTGEIFIDTTSTFYTLFKSNGDGKGHIRLVSTILFHEVLHPMLLHWKRMKTRDPELWNIAGDFVINLLLANLEEESSQKVRAKGGNVTKIVDMSVRQIPDGHIMISDTFANMIEEEVYDMLLQKGHFEKTEQFFSFDDFMKSDGEGDDDGTEDQDPNGKGDPVQSYDNEEDVPGPAIKETTTKFDFEGKKFEHKNVQFPKMDPSQMTPEQKEEAGKRRKRGQMANKMLEAELSKGVGSQSLKDFLGRLFNVKIDWEKILKDSLLTALEPSDEQTWGLPEVSWMANPHMPYLPSTRDEVVRGIAIFAIDESGSMGDEDVKKAFDIVLQSWEHYKGLYVIKHDHGVVWEKRYDEKPTTEEINELATRRSHGGTSHKEVFEKVVKFLNQDDEAKVSVFIGCTDLYSDIEQYQKIFTTEIPRVWIANSNHKIDGLIGRVIRLK